MSTINDEVLDLLRDKYLIRGLPPIIREWSEEDILKVYHRLFCVYDPKYKLENTLAKRSRTILVRNLRLMGMGYLVPKQKNLSDTSNVVKIVTIVDDKINSKYKRNIISQRVKAALLKDLPNFTKVLKENKSSVPCDVEQDNVAPNVQQTSTTQKNWLLESPEPSCNVAPVYTPPLSEGFQLPRTPFGMDKVNHASENNDAPPNKENPCHAKIPPQDLPTKVPRNDKTSSSDNFIPCGRQIPRTPRNLDMILNMPKEIDNSLTNMKRSIVSTRQFSSDGDVNIASVVCSNEQVRQSQSTLANSMSCDVAFNKPLAIPPVDASCRKNQDPITNPMEQVTLEMVSDVNENKSSLSPLLQSHPTGKKYDLHRTYTICQADRNPSEEQGACIIQPKIDMSSNYTQLSPHSASKPLQNTCRDSPTDCKMANISSNSFVGNESAVYKSKSLADYGAEMAASGRSQENGEFVVEYTGKEREKAAVYSTLIPKKVLQLHDKPLSITGTPELEDDPSVTLRDSGKNIIPKGKQLKRTPTGPSPIEGYEKGCILLNHSVQENNKTFEVSVIEPNLDYLVQIYVKGNLPERPDGDDICIVDTKAAKEVEEKALSTLQRTQEKEPVPRKAIKPKRIFKKEYTAVHDVCGTNKKLKNDEEMQRSDDTDVEKKLEKQEFLIGESENMSESLQIFPSKKVKQDETKAVEHFKKSKGHGASEIILEINTEKDNETFEAFSDIKRESVVDIRSAKKNKERNKRTESKDKKIENEYVYEKEDTLGDIKLNYGAEVLVKDVTNEMKPSCSIENMASYERSKTHDNMDEGLNVTLSKKDHKSDKIVRGRSGKEKGKRGNTKNGKLINQEEREKIGVETIETKLGKQKTKPEKTVRHEVTCNVKALQADCINKKTKHISSKSDQPTRKRKADESKSDKKEISDVEKSSPAHQDSQTLGRINLKVTEDDDLVIDNRSLNIVKSPEKDMDGVALCIEATKTETHGKGSASALSVKKKKAKSTKSQALHQTSDCIASENKRNTTERSRPNRKRTKIISKNIDMAVEINQSWPSEANTTNVLKKDKASVNIQDSCRVEDDSGLAKIPDGKSDMLHSSTNTRKSSRAKKNFNHSLTNSTITYSKVKNVANQSHATRLAKVDDLDLIQSAHTSKKRDDLDQSAINLNSSGVTRVQRLLRNKSCNYQSEFGNTSNNIASARGRRGNRIAVATFYESNLSPLDELESDVESEKPPSNSRHKEVADSTNNCDIPKSCSEKLAKGKIVSTRKVSKTRKVEGESREMLEGKAFEGIDNSIAQVEGELHWDINYQSWPVNVVSEEDCRNNSIANTPEKVDITSNVTCRKTTHRKKVGGHQAKTQRSVNASVSHSVLDTFCEVPTQRPSRRCKTLAKASISKAFLDDSDPISHHIKTVRF